MLRKPGPGVRRTDSGTRVGVDRLVVANHGLTAAGIVGLPGVSAQSGHILEPSRGAADQLGGEHPVQVHPLRGCGEGHDPLLEAGGVGDPLHLGGLGGVVAVGAYGQARGGCVVAQPGEPLPELAE